MVLVWTLILVIGNKTRFTAIQPVTQKPRDLPDAGFTLIELLVAIAVMAVVLGLAVLAFPNHDERYWRDNLDQLTASLNMAQEESAMAGSVIVAQVDALGWRFFIPTGSAGNLAAAPNNNASPTVPNASGLMPDVFRPYNWYKPVEIASLQISLGGEQVMPVLQIPIKQENRQALLMRNARGKFSWTTP